MAFDRAAMDEAGQQAHAELAKIRAGLTPEQETGVRVIIGWLQRNYRTAGYKRLCRPLVGINKQ